jgi:hypothetical protein
MHAPSLVMLISPSNFRPNVQTAADNAYVVQGGNTDKLAAQAKREHQSLVDALVAHGVETIVLPGINPDLPDELFLNNWFSTHDDARGRSLAIVYPLRWETRRKERRADVIAALKQHYDEVLDLSPYETQGKYLEATGSLVFDRKLRRVYAARSARTNEELARLVAGRLGYELIIFDTLGLGGRPIYHTNVMMYVGADIAVACLDVIAKPQRDVVAGKLAEKRELLVLTEAQVNEFAGNGFELANSRGEAVLAMSDRAHRSLTKDQLAILKKHYGNRIVHPSFAAIEQGGGSVRCTLAALHTNDPATLVLAIAQKSVR